MIKNDAYYHVNEQLGEYRVLNMDETMREWIDYELPDGAEMTEGYREWIDANKYIQYLNQLNRDPSYMVAVFGYYIDNEDYVKVVFRVRASY